MKISPGTNGDVVAVVIPCYKVTRHVLDVIARIGPECHLVFVVDDCCPDGSGALVTAQCNDARVQVIRHAANLGVGGAVMTGYRAAIDAGATVIVKIDGDGQMPPELLPLFIRPITSGAADYTKGNRFYDLTSLRRMPTTRLFGNAMLSFTTKLSAGYWNLFDPTNGYTAINADVARHLPFDKISRRYFFETDILFRLNILRAVVVDVPMDTVYEDEKSNLRISRIIGEFALKNGRNLGKRIFYNYFLRDFSLASIELIVGLCLSIFGVVYGAIHWIESSTSGQLTSAGTVMVSALPLLVGIQLLISFLNYDIASVPRRPIHPTLLRGGKVDYLRRIPERSSGRG